MFVDRGSEQVQRPETCYYFLKNDLDESLFCSDRWLSFLFLLAIVEFCYFVMERNYTY
jgi:hypothetical protein